MKQDFAVIDVNLPKHVSDYDDSQEHEPSELVDARNDEAGNLLTYLWNNYIELNEPTHVFLMGTNIGHGAIMKFIKADEERAQERVTGMISFVGDVPLQSCKSATNDFLPTWYFNSSLVFVSQDHNWWFSDLKPRKRFGKVIRSSADPMNGMLLEHRQEVFDFLLQETSDWTETGPENDGHSAVDTGTVETRMPPVGNFALSPRPQVATAAVESTTSTRNVSSPKARIVKSPRLETPPRMPPLGNFALSPRPRSSRSPAR